MKGISVNEQIHEQINDQINEQINISYLSFNFCRPPALLVVHAGLQTTDKY